MTKKKKFALLIGVIAIVFLGLFLVATFYDLQISMAIADLSPGQYYTRNIFGVILEIIGEFPIYLVTTFAVCLLFHNASRRASTRLIILIKILLVIACVGLATFMAYRLFKYTSQHFGFADKLGHFTDIFAYLIIGAIYTYLILRLTKRATSAFLNKMLIWSLIVIFAALISQILSASIKSLAGRPRFRTLNTIGDFDLYRPWYDFRGKVKPDELMSVLGVASDGFKSFPSGHSAAAMMSVFIIAIPYCSLSLNSNKYKIIFKVVAVAFPLLVMLARIIAGAHYLSDVLIGSLLTVVASIVSTCLVKWLFCKRVVISPLKEKPTITIEESQE